MKPLNLILKLIVGFGTAYLFANALMAMQLNPFFLIPFIIFIAYAIVKLEEGTAILMIKGKKFQHYVQPEWKRKMPQHEKMILEWILFILFWICVAMIWTLGRSIFVV